MHKALAKYDAVKALHLISSRDKNWSPVRNGTCIRTRSSNNAGHAAC
jgi:hypothetical protein